MSFTSRASQISFSQLLKDLCSPLRVCIWGDRASWETAQEVLSSAGKRTRSVKFRDHPTVDQPVSIRRKYLKFETSEGESRSDQNSARPIAAALKADSLQRGNHPVRKLRQKATIPIRTPRGDGGNHSGVKPS